MGKKKKARKNKVFSCEGVRGFQKSKVKGKKCKEVKKKR